MEDKEAINVLIKILDKYPFDEKEIESVKTAIGVLGWTSLSKSRIKSLKEKRNRS